MPNYELKITKLLRALLVLATHSSDQARSQEFAKGGGGLFWKLETTVNELGLNFHQF